MASDLQRQDFKIMVDSVVAIKNYISFLDVKGVGRLRIKYVNC